jgi:hypothetical protein
MQMKVFPGGTGFLLLAAVLHIQILANGRLRKAETASYILSSAKTHQLVGYGPEKDRDW